MSVLLDSNEKKTNSITRREPITPTAYFWLVEKFVGFSLCLWFKYKKLVEVYVETMTIWTDWNSAWLQLLVIYTFLFTYTYLLISDTFLFS